MFVDQALVLRRRRLSHPGLFLQSLPQGSILGGRRRCGLSAPCWRQVIKLRIERDRRLLLVTPIEVNRLPVGEGARPDTSPTNRDRHAKAGTHIPPARRGYTNRSCCIRAALRSVGRLWPGAPIRRWCLFVAHALGGQCIPHGTTMCVFPHPLFRFHVRLVMPRILLLHDRCIVVQHRVSVLTFLVNWMFNGSATVYCSTREGVL